MTDTTTEAVPLLSNARKARPIDGSAPPHAEFTAPGYSCLVLQTYSKNHTKSHARWFCAVDLGLFGPVGENYGYGDTYVADVARHRPNLWQVDGRAPTLAEEQEWAEIMANASAPGF